MNRRLVLPISVIALLLAAPLWAEEPAAIGHEFHVTGMTCGHCAEAIEKGLRGIEGVRDVQVDREAERVRVTVTPDIGTDTLEAAIEGAGSYQAALVDPAPGDRTADD